MKNLTINCMTRLVGEMLDAREQANGLPAQISEQATAVKALLAGVKATACGCPDHSPDESKERKERDMARVLTQALLLVFQAGRLFEHDDVMKAGYSISLAQDVLWGQGLPAHDDEPEATPESVAEAAMAYGPHAPLIVTGSLEKAAGEVAEAFGPEAAAQFMNVAKAILEEADDDFEAGDGHPSPGAVESSVKVAAKAFMEGLAEIEEAGADMVRETLINEPVYSTLADTAEALVALDAELAAEIVARVDAAGRKKGRDVLLAELIGHCLAGLA